MTVTYTALPEVIRTSEDPAVVAADVLIVALRKQSEAVEVAASGFGTESSAALRAAAEAIAHSGEAGALARIPAPESFAATSVLLVGVGEGPEALRRAVGSALRSLSGVATVALAFPVADHDAAEAVTLGALLGAYRYTAYSSDPGRPVQQIIVIAEEEAQSEVDRAVVISRAITATRDLVNQPPLDLFPAAFAGIIAEQAAAAGVGVEVIDDEQLRERGFGGLVGVGQGSSRGPRLVKLSYAPAGAERHLALVGKGITFDTGGISIKPAARMENMKSDMAGAAAAAQALFAVAKLGLPVRVTAWLAIAENMPSGSAVRPSDVLRMYGGKTVEVINTDAEGRLVLADALVAAGEDAPDRIIDIATLTGAQVAALGRRTSGVMGTTVARDEVLAAAEAAGETMWGMPIPDEMLEGYRSNTADLKNVGGPAGGMLGAAAFLREFVAEGVEWAHLDVAGPAYNSESAYGYTGLGGTGVPVRTLVEVARRLS